MLGEHSPVLADTRRWAWFNCMGAQMCRMDTGKVHGPSPLAPYHDFLCSECKQMSVPGETISAQPADQPLVCPSCRAARDSERHEVVRLFTPAPNQIAGQLALDA